MPNPSSAGTPTRFDEAGTRARVKAEIERSGSIASAFNHATVTTKQDWTGAIDRIDMSTLVIHGENDPIVPLANGTAIAAHIKGAELHVLRDAGHELNPIDLDEICATIVTFLRRLDDQRG